MSELRARLEMEATRGDLVPFVLDGRPSLLLAHPRLVGHVLVDHASRYGKIEKDRPLLGRGLVTSDGDEWSAQRREASRMFAADPERRAAVLARAVRALVAEWSEPGVRDVVPGLVHYIVTVLGESFFELECDRDTTAQLGSAVARVARGRDMEAIGQVSALARRIVAHGRYEPFFNHFDQITTFLLAGTETSTSTLAWALYLLGEAPDVVTALREGDDDMATAVMNETLRLYPPVWALTREARAVDTIDGVRVEPGTALYVFVRQLHRDQRFWRQPERFDPGRFLHEQQVRFSFLPFGVGARTCAGRRFATTEIVAALRSVVQAYDIRRPPDSTPPREGAFFTLRPDGPVMVDFRPRR